jgi:hypothetical protein
VLLALLRREAEGEPECDSLRVAPALGVCEALADALPLADAHALPEPAGAPGDTVPLCASVRVAGALRDGGAPLPDAAAEAAPLRDALAVAPPPPPPPPPSLALAAADALPDALPVDEADGERVAPPLADKAAERERDAVALALTVPTDAVAPALPEKVTVARGVPESDADAHAEPVSADALAHAVSVGGAESDAHALPVAERVHDALVLSDSAALALRDAHSEPDAASVSVRERAGEAVAAALPLRVAAALTETLAPLDSDAASDALPVAARDARAVADAVGAPESAGGALSAAEGVLEARATLRETVAVAGADGVADALDVPVGDRLRRPLDDAVAVDVADALVEPESVRPPLIDTSAENVAEDDTDADAEPVTDADAEAVDDGVTDDDDVGDELVESRALCEDVDECDGDRVSAAIVADTEGLLGDGDDVALCDEVCVFALDGVTDLEPATLRELVVECEPVRERPIDRVTAKLADSVLLTAVVMV